MKTKEFKTKRDLEYAVKEIESMHKVLSDAIADKFKEDGTQIPMYPTRVHGCDDVYGYRMEGGFDKFALCWGKYEWDDEDKCEHSDTDTLYLAIKEGCIPVDNVMIVKIADYYDKWSENAFFVEELKQIALDMDIPMASAMVGFGLSDLLNRLEEYIKAKIVKGYHFEFGEDWELYRFAGLNPDFWDDMVMVMDCHVPVLLTKGQGYADHMGSLYIEEVLYIAQHMKK